MTSAPAPPAGLHRVLELYDGALRALVKTLAWVAGAALLLMVVTTMDVLLRGSVRP
jgi:hypothetical protein